MSVTPQAKFPLFSTDVGSRIAFVRERQGLTLERLGEGRASTAQSWEQGKMPRREKWSGIAERLQVSETFIFHGVISTVSDYAFVAKYRDEIEGAESALRVAYYRLRLNTEEDEDPLGDAARTHPEANLPDDAYVKSREKDSPPAPDPKPQNSQMLRPEHRPKREPTEQTIREHFEKYLAAARAAPGGIGHAWIQVRKHLRLDDFEIEPPEHET